MNHPGRLIADWLAALSASGILVYEGAKMADEISADGAPSGGISPLVIVVIAALLMLHLLVAALRNTAHAVTSEREGAAFPQMTSQEDRDCPSPTTSTF